MTSSSSSPKSPEPNQDITQQDRAKLLDLFQKKDLPGGTRLAERLKKTYPKSLVLFVTLGMAYDLQEKADKSIANFEKAMALAKMLDRFGEGELRQLTHAGIKFISTLAINKLIMKHKYKAKDIHDIRKAK